MVFDFVEAHRVVIPTGQPNYVTARVSVPSRLHIPSWRLFLHDYHDNIICHLSLVGRLVKSEILFPVLLIAPIVAS